MSQQNDSYHLLLKYLPDAFARHRLIINDKEKPVDYEFIDVNSAFEEMTGLKKENVIGKNVSELFPTIKSLRFDWVDTFGRVTLTGEGIRFVQYFQPLKRWYDITAYSDEAGYFVTIFRDITATRKQDAKMVLEFSEDGKASTPGTWDITDQRQSEEKLRKSEEKYRALVENLNEIVYILDEKAKITYVSPSIHSISGYSPSEVIGMKYYDLSHPDDREARISQFRKILTGVNEVTESRFIAKDGQVIWLRTAARPVVSEGSVVGVQGVLTDITEQKQLEKSLQQSEAFIKSVMDNLPIGIAVNSVEPTVEFEYINDNFIKFYRIKREDLAVPDIFWEAVYQDKGFREIIKKRVLDDCASGDPTRMRWENIPVKRKGKEPFYITAMNIPFPDKPYMISTVWDVTDRQQSKEKLQEWQNVMHYIIQHDPNAIAVLDKELKYIYVSDRYLKDYSFKKRDVVGRHHYKIFPETPQKWRDVHQRALAGEVISSEEDFFIREDGSIEHTRWQCRPWHHCNGSIGGIILYTEVITKRKQAEIAFRENLNRLNALLANSPNLITIFDKDEKYIEVSAAAADFFGLHPEQIKGKTFAELLPPEVVSEFRQTINELQAKQQVINKIDTIKLNDESRVFESWIFPVETKGSEIELFGSIAVDITDRKQAEENLKHSEGEKSLILNVISERITYLDANYRVIWANRIAAESVGMKVEELTGRMCYELWHQREEPCLGCPIKKAYETKKPQVGEVITPDGCCWYLRGYPVMNHEQKLIGIIKVAKDITEQKSKERDLKESEQRFRKLVELAPDAIFVQIERKFFYINQAAADLFGAESKEQLIGKPVMERFHPKYHQAVLERIEKLNQDKQPIPWLEQVYLKLDGTPVDVEVSAVPIRFQLKDGALVYVRDITERKQQERQNMNEQALLRQQQKLEAIGVLASGVAHEINNPINGIINYGSLF